MKFLFINVVCGIRSTGRICTDLATALELQGHEVKIAYGRETVPAEFQKYAIRIGSNLDNKMHALKARLFDGAGFGSVSATKKFIKWVKEYDPDVIHLHNIHGYYINIEILFNYLHSSGKRIVWTLHDCWAFTGHSAYCDTVNCEKWITGCFECPILRLYPASFVDRSKTNWKKKKRAVTQIPNLTIVTPSNWLAGLVKKSFLANYPIEVINNGIDVELFREEKNDFKKQNGIEGRKMILGVSTSWNELKGYSDYIHMSEILGEEYKIVLVGLTRKQINRLPPSIIGIERTNSIQELAQLYTAADVFVNLSYCENYPTVNLEAICCGTPIITYNVGGSSETVLQGSGSVIEKGKYAQIQTVIENLCKTKVDMIDRTSIDKNYCYQKYMRLYGIKGK